VARSNAVLDTPAQPAAIAAPSSHSACANGSAGGSLSATVNIALAVTKVRAAAASSAATDARRAALAESPAASQ
jgi:hypothetical protein